MPGSKINVSVSSNRPGLWNFHCDDCPDFDGDTISDAAAVQEALDHLNLYHPRTVMQLSMT